MAADRRIDATNPHPFQPGLVVSSESQGTVKKPSYYTKYVIEPVTFIMLNNLPFWMGNVIKYVMRAGGKVYEGMTVEQSEIRDLEKAARYIEMRINQIKGKAVL